MVVANNHHLEKLFDSVSSTEPDIDRIREQIGFLWRNSPNSWDNRGCLQGQTGELTVYNACKRIENVYPRYVRVGIYEEKELSGDLIMLPRRFGRAKIARKGTLRRFSDIDLVTTVSTHDGILPVAWEVKTGKYGKSKGRDLREGARGALRKEKRKQQKKFLNQYFDTDDTLYVAVLPKDHIDETLGGQQEFSKRNFLVPLPYTHDELIQIVENNLLGKRPPQEKSYFFLRENL